MPLELDLQTDQVLPVHDTNNDVTLHFIYDEPTTEDRIKYKSALINTAVKKNASNQIQWFQIEFGLKHIKGLQDGDLIKKGLPVSTDSAKENYLPEWKEILKRNYGYLVVLFVEQVFERVCTIAKEEPANADFFGESTKTT